MSLVDLNAELAPTLENAMLKMCFVRYENSHLKFEQLGECIIFTQHTCPCKGKAIPWVPHLLTAGHVLSPHVHKSKVILCRPCRHAHFLCCIFYVTLQSKCMGSESDLQLANLKQDHAWSYSISYAQCHIHLKSQLRVIVK